MSEKLAILQSQFERKSGAGYSEVTVRQDGAIEFADTPNSTPRNRRDSTMLSGDGMTVTFDGSLGEIETVKRCFDLCRHNGVVLAKDVARIHELLGEPIGENEALEACQRLGVSLNDPISFMQFIKWWQFDHQGDGVTKGKKQRYTEKFKVLCARLENAAIRHIRTRSTGSPGSLEYRVWFEHSVGGKTQQISCWHDIPYKNSDGSYNFVCEIPKWTRAKFEIATGEKYNPIKQDTKNGKLRFYTYGDMFFNYGAFPQTWEDPSHISPDTKAPGDNDPIDVIEIGTRQRPTGSITPVKVLGVIAMIDDGETDWKMIALACDDSKASQIHNIADVNAHMPGAMVELTRWLRLYKTVDGKPENKFGFDVPKDRDFAVQVVEECHQHWRHMVARRLVLS